MCVFDTTFQKPRVSGKAGSKKTETRRKRRGGERMWAKERKQREGEKKNDAAPPGPPTMLRARFSFLVRYFFCQGALSPPSRFKVRLPRWPVDVLTVPFQEF